MVVLVLGPGSTSESISSFASTISGQDSRRQHENPAKDLFSLGGNGNNFSINHDTVTSWEDDGNNRQNNRRQYESPAAEMAALFNRGRCSSSHSFNRGVNYTR